MLRGVDFELAAGEFVAVVGQSGSGKSTLLHLLGLLDAPDAGEVHWTAGGSTTCPAGERDRLRNTAHRHGLPVLPPAAGADRAGKRAGPADDPPRRAGLAHATAGEARRRGRRELLDRFGLGHRLQHKPRQLSGGEMQRVAIARALVAGPQLLLADEPTGNLDAESGAGILDVLCALNRAEGLTIVIVTHDASIARRADRIVRLAAGRVETA